MSEVDAEQAYRDYCKAVKERKEKYLQELKKVYYNLKQGKKVINIFEACKKAGVNEDGNPRLAISIAGKPSVRFRKQARGSGTFYNGVAPWYKPDVQLPSETYAEWKRLPPTKYQNGRGSIKSETIETGVPVVPAHLLPKGKLDRYYVLWEVKDWKALPQTKDPFLLKRLSNNLFVVLAEWELTAIEQAVIQGAIE